MKGRRKLLLALDVGNTTTLLGLFRGEDLKATWRIGTVRGRTADELGALLRDLFQLKGLRLEEVGGLAISCVVPPLLPALEAMANQYFGLKPLIVGPGTRTGISILYDNPREVGADRVVNAVGGYARYGGPLIVVDFGTATTFDAISARGEYLGGAIAPGISISVGALFEETAKLPRVEIVRPSAVIGKDTVSSMQAGIVYGYMGLVSGIVSRMKEEMGGSAKVVATGGEAELIGAELNIIDAIDPFLILDGLRLIYARNAPGSQGKPAASDLT